MLYFIVMTLPPWTVAIITGHLRVVPWITSVTFCSNPEVLQVVLEDVMGRVGWAVAMVHPVPCPSDSLIHIPSIEVESLCLDTIPIDGIVHVKGHCVEHSCVL